MNFEQISRPILHLSNQPNRKALLKQEAIPTTPAPVWAQLVLIRGLPGSGKSTMARFLARMGYQHLEADMFFDVDGVYQFDATRIRDAHAWCQRMTRQCLTRGESVVVSNTFTAMWEMEPYFAMATGTIRVIEVTEKFANVYGVPAESVARMAARWESMPQDLNSSTFYTH